MEKKHEADTLQLYHDQQEIAQQQTTIDKYQSMITNVISLREEKDSHVREAKSVHRATRVKLSDEKRKEENLLHEMEQLAALQAQFSQWQTELASDLAVSKRVSDKDKTVQRELIARKQYKDCIIFKLMEEVWRIKTEIAGLDVQLQLKNREKTEISRMMGDVNADLEALHRQHANLCDAWNSVVSNIAKRNRVYEQLNAEREYVR
jgi:chromosome segregation ATPase